MSRWFRSLPRGIIDTHVHTAPDVVPRRQDDHEFVRAADEAGFAAVVLKSHHDVTATRATLAERSSDTMRVFGGAVLNLHATGGLNPFAVDTALRLGARVIWLPTITAGNQVRQVRSGSITSDNLRSLGLEADAAVEVLDAHGAILPDLAQILDRIAEAGATLATGHIGASESMVVVPEARRRGVANVIVTHPEHSCVGMSIEQQQELAELGHVWFERVYAMTRPGSDGVPIAALASNAVAVGVETTIMATDLGQAHNVPPVEGFRAYIAGARDAGISAADIEQMVVHNPRVALGLGAGGI